MSRRKTSRRRKAAPRLPAGVVQLTRIADSLNNISVNLTEVTMLLEDIRDNPSPPPPPNKPPETHPALMSELQAQTFAQSAIAHVLWTGPSPKPSAPPSKPRRSHKDMLKALGANAFWNGQPPHVILAAAKSDEDKS